MTCYLEYADNITGTAFSFSPEETAYKVMEAVLDSEHCPYEAAVNVLLTDNGGIRDFNRQYRNIDWETDVLSFPNIEYGTPADFSHVEEAEADYFDPDSGELLLGDIILSVDKVREQSERYGHSQLREFAFLIAHSMFHLCGYDHMEEGEAAVMEEKQGKILESLGIVRD